MTGDGYGPCVGAASFLCKVNRVRGKATPWGPPELFASRFVSRADLPGPGRKGGYVTGDEADCGCGYRDARLELHALCVRRLDVTLWRPTTDECRQLPVVPTCQTQLYTPPPTPGAREVVSRHELS